ncbi:Bacterial DnaG primase, TOPRIM domain [uncultured Caudovirales phage]|uniref:Bacterial DnaG primase, TOPRIM domain n=1 Tax=uncultured Caudovirales phage TaxID=2100421 RepID=A0A6J5QD50_9CAUD|nr:Bacterial DnaG primase, TOPRIM domain [uncultured Caudovirales phage]CAB4174412.1 Bacterial DnaG primase, TOPRIM domain [uncultured Caudovirales phage]CAB4179451.1 Bacterial DnaG primase, TOPRIM domain [uncultured Caudovirales phage]CAB4189155.1 Bacterial DnaG primase, TOPRIM domain [uncultured Caudovirales phage]CAB4193531.1 Bacterial DnaG primase, TOPRIM domain [uncultured Caudovirales phage]
MIDVERVLLSLDIALVAQRGEEVQGLCPMHKARTGKEDHNPSWWINSITGAHICFSCGYKGNVYTLVADLKGMDYFDAKDYVDSSAELDVDVLLKRIRELPQYVSVEEPITMSEARLAVFIDPPENELRKRFISAEAAKHHNVLWDANNSAWILPIRDPNDYSLWGWQEKGARGRFFRNQPQGVKKSKTVFGVEVMTTKTLVVVESPLDVPRLATAGIDGAISTYGAIISEEQVKIMRRATKVIAAFDKDDAGMHANEAIRVFARKYGIELAYFNYTGIDVKDPGDMTAKEIQQGVATARDMIYGKEAYSWH